MTHRGRSTFFALSLLFVIAGCIYGENVLVYDAHQGIIRDDTGIGIVSLSIYEVTESGAKKRPYANSPLMKRQMHNLKFTCVAPIRTMS